MRHRTARTVLGLAALVVGIVALAVIAGAFAVSHFGGGGDIGYGQVSPLDRVTDEPARSGPRRPARERPPRERRVTVPAPAAVPVSLEIPSIGVEAPIIRLGLNGDGSLEVPKAFGDTGWWSGGARPGDPGPAVIVGHVDSHDGPAVFFRIRELGPGDGIAVVGADGRRARFTVLGSEQHPKDRFPTDRVYGPTAGPTLRLITCSGTFDQSTGHYIDNTIVYAAAA